MAQPDLRHIADSIIQRDRHLFDTAAMRAEKAPGLGEQKPKAERLPSTWSPKFPTTYNRRDLLELEDTPPVLLSYNRADGLFLGLGSNFPAELFKERRLQGYFGFGYGFGSHYWQVFGGLQHDFLAEETPLRIGVEGHILTDTRDAWKMGRIENTAFSLLAGVDARDYFQRRGFSISAQQFIAPRVAIKGEFRLDTYANSRREVGWSLFGPKQPFFEVPPIREGKMSSVAISALADFISLRSWSDPQFGIEAEAEFGSTERSSGALRTDGTPYDGGFAEYTIDARLKLEAIPDLAWIALRGRLGIATGDAPPQRLFTIGGLGTLPGFPQNIYQGNRMVLVQSDLLIAPLASVYALRDLRVILANDFGAVSNALPDAGIFEGMPEGTGAYLYSPGIYLGSATGNFRIGYAFRTDRFEDPKLVVRLTQEW
jgi:hypothetical protein